MGANLAGKRVLVLSDNDGLSRAIELNLERSHLEVVKFALSSPRPRYPEHTSSRACRGVEGWESQNEVGDFDLIVVAMSSPASEPVVALYRASLVGQIGQVPLLIISDRPFQSDPGDRIIHLDFPFDIDGLHDKVEKILQDRSMTSGG
jgi:hypothetical protein